MAAAQLDTPLTGQPLRFGFSSVLWGGLAALAGFGIGAWGAAGRAVVVIATVILGALFVCWFWFLGGLTLITG